MTDVLRNIEFDEGRFLGLLEKLINNADKVQNSPPTQEPQEGIIADFVFETLSPYLVENGGVLEARRVEYKAGRPNIIITYRGQTDKVVSLVGAHMDVVPANPDLWTRPPFKFAREGNIVYGRGTTDCLGHVALITTLMTQIAELKPQISTTIHVIFIASEELPWPGVGIDEMMARGDCDLVMGGPVLWVDAADSQPCVGTAGSTQWVLTATGKLFHSGFPNTTVNAFELAMDAVHYMQDRFYVDFPPTEKEKQYKFTAPSSFKPTTARPGGNSINQIPGTFSICGDIRLSPSYTMEDMKAKVHSYLEDFKKIKGTLGRGPSKYEVDGIPSEITLEIEKGTRGVYCSMDSPGFVALDKAVKEVRGSSSPYAVSGSLPIVGDLKAAGMDIQITGFGLMKTYHGNDEHALISDLLDGGRVLAHFIANYEDELH